MSRLSLDEWNGLMSAVIPEVWFDVWEEHGGFVIGIHENLNMEQMRRLTCCLPSGATITSDENNVIEIWVRDETSVSIR